MFRTTNTGFSLIELLVTLVLIGLLSGIVAPGVFTWLDARDAARKRDELNNILQLLPLKAYFNNETIELNTLSSIPNSNIDATFNEPLIVLNTGYCLGATGYIMVNDRKYTFRVSAPFCDVQYE